MFGIRLLSSFSTQPLSSIRPRKRVVVGQDDDVAVDAWPCESGPWTFPKYSGFALMSSK